MDQSKLLGYIQHTFEQIHGYLKVENNRIWIRDSRFKDVKQRIQNAPLRRIYGQKI